MDLVCSWLGTAQALGDCSEVDLSIVQKTHYALGYITGDIISKFQEEED